MKSLLPCFAFLVLVPGCTFDPFLDRPDSGYYPCEPEGHCLLDDDCFCFEDLHCVPRIGSDPGACWPDCRTNSDCDDEDHCTHDICVEGSYTCSHDPLSFPGAEGPGTCQNSLDDDCDGLTDAEDTADCGCTDDDDCEDGNECTDDSCQGGVCASVPVGARDCSGDGNPCTLDQCVEGVCTHPPVLDDTQCDDEIFCTDPDSCTAGVCSGPPRNCDDNDPGTVDVCSENDMACHHLTPGEEICWNDLDEDFDGKTDECCLGDGDFVFHTSYPTAAQPWQIRATDFNEDGALDLLVASGASPAPALLLYPGNLNDGRPDGTFAAPTALVTDAAFNSVAVADLDGDDILDIAGTRLNGDLMILFGGGSNGRGDGSIGSSEFYTVCDSSYWIEAADFDLDHVPDLVIGCHAADGTDLTVYHGRRNESMPAYDLERASPVLLPVDQHGTEPAGVVSLTVADVSGNGKPDIAAVAGPSEDLYVVLSCTAADCIAGPFLPAVGYPLGGQPLFVTSGDFDLNGTVDLAVSVDVEPEWNKIHFLDGLGDGTFLDGFETDFPTLPGVLADGDFNGDRIPDLIEVEWDGDHASVMIGQGSNGLPNGSYDWGADVVVGEHPYWVLPADFNADGIQDLAFTLQPPNDLAADGSLEIYLGTGRGGHPDGTFRSGPTFPAGPGAIDLAAADFDADGIADLAVANRDESTVNILLGNGADGRGDGTFTPQGLSLSPEIQPASVLALDLDGDHISDLAVANQGSSSVSIFLGLGTDGRGNGDFAIRTDQYLDDAWPNGPLDLATADFDGDGSPDLAALVQDFDMVVILFDYTGAFPAEPFDGEISFPAGHRPVSVLAGDFNEDGRIDLATAGIKLDDRGSINILLNRTQPGDDFPVFDANVPIWIPGGFRGLSSGDYDGNGVLDLAAANYSNASITILLGNGSNGVGDGMFVLLTDFPAFASPQRTLTHDFDGDNLLDLAVVGGGLLGILLGQGDGNFLPVITYPTGGGPRGIVANRFNADGFVDIAIANRGSGDVSILFGEGACTPP